MRPDSYEPLEIGGRRALGCVGEYDRGRRARITWYTSEAGALALFFIKRARSSG